jgi:hypothetical protein
MSGRISLLFSRLTEFGVPGAEAAEILALAMAAGAAEAEPKRSVGAERTARWRAEQKASQSVTERHNVTLCDVMSDNQKDPQTPKKPSLPKENPPKGGKKKGAPLPAAWEPEEEDRTYGRKLGMTEFQIDDAAEEIRLWAGANENRDVARKINWSKAFKAWMRRYVRQNKIVPFGGVPVTPSSKPDRPFVEWETPQWEAWAAYLKSRGKMAPTATYSRDVRAMGWRFDSEWPPLHQIAAE